MNSVARFSSNNFESRSLPKLILARVVKYFNTTSFAVVTEQAMVATRVSLISAGSFVVFEMNDLLGRMFKFYLAENTFCIAVFSPTQKREKERKTNVIPKSVCVFLR